jgi:hypothetical protein
MHMNRRILALAGLAVAACAGVAPTGYTKELPMMHAKGTFEVSVQPRQRDTPEAQAAGVDRLSLDKRFHGALDANSQGEMLAIGDGSTAGAYVALEKIAGSLDGRHGSFALMHRSGLRDGNPEHWSILVVPDSGTDELLGIDGEMRITIVDGKHHYDLQYTLPDG